MRRTGDLTVVWPDKDPVTGDPALRMAAPLWNTNGSLKGYVEAVIQPRDIQVLAKSATQKLPELTASVLDAEGRVLGSEQVQGQGMQILGGVELYAPATEAVARVGPNEAGAMMRAAVVPVTQRGLKWTVVVTVAEAGVQSHVVSVQRQTLLLSVAAFLGALVLAGLFAHGLTEPVRRLATYAAKIGSGDAPPFLDAIAPWHPRELDVLAREIVRMWGQLRVRQEDLEQQVAERTAALQASEAYFRALIENSSDLIVVLDREGAMQYVSPSHRTVLGYDSETLIGRSAFQLVHPDDAPGLERTFRKNVAAGFVGLGQLQELRFRHADGSWRWLEAVASVAPPTVGFGIVVNSRDITERKATEAALEHLALHDGLTQLPNRTLLHDRLTQALSRSGREQLSVALLVLDLNRFKEINDTLGHHIGDAVLAAVSERLLDMMRKSDTVARLGGDEFAVVLPGADGVRAQAVAAEINAVLEDPIDAESHSLMVGASIGIAVAPEHGTEASELLRRADVAMYMAKRANAGAALYSAEHDHQSTEQLVLASDLRQAISESGLELHYQLKADLGTGSSVGVEALVRWRHPERGFVPPDMFIPIAEDTGLIQPLTHWVLTTALRQLRDWLDHGLDLTMAVNVSVRNLNERNLPEVIAGLLHEHRVPASRLRIEVTESSLMTDPGRSVAVLSRLREMGIGVAIDDFGTGYSSLAYLKRLPVDELKIDRSFVRDLAHDRDDTAIVRTTIELGHELGLTVVAEGIEDQATWDRLTALGCDLGQGYFFVRPEPASLVTARLLEFETSATSRRAA